MVKLPVSSKISGRGSGQSLTPPFPRDVIYSLALLHDHSIVENTHRFIVRQDPPPVWSLIRVLMFTVSMVWWYHSAQSDNTAADKSVSRAANLCTSILERNVQLQKLKSRFDKNLKFS